MKLALGLIITKASLIIFSIPALATEKEAFLCLGPETCTHLTQNDNKNFIQEIHDNTGIVVSASSELSYEDLNSVLTEFLQALKSPMSQVLKENEYDRIFFHEAWTDPHMITTPATSNGEYVFRVPISSDAYGIQVIIAADISKSEALIFDENRTLLKSKYNIELDCDTKRAACFSTTQTIVSDPELKPYLKRISNLIGSYSFDQSDCSGAKVDNPKIRISIKQEMSRIRALYGDATGECEAMRHYLQVSLSPFVKSILVKQELIKIGNLIEESMTHPNRVGRTDKGFGTWLKKTFLQ